MEYSKYYSGEEVEGFVKKLKEELRQAKEDWNAFGDKHNVNDTIDRVAKESFE